MNCFLWIVPMFVRVRPKTVWPEWHAMAGKKVGFR